MNDPVKILVIDDSEDDRMLYRRTLQKSTTTQYHITEAGDGEEGLERMREEEPACVLLDYSLSSTLGS